jgi:2-C-methyl-D-erythritol 4-phosphate cytidylyltransferase
VSKNVAVIICAAGPGKRFGGKRKKQFTDVSGRAVFLRSVEIFAGRDDVKQILLGISKEDDEIVQIKWGASLKFHHTRTFFGGSQRFDTVIEGLKLLKEDIELVAVHDAARCCITDQLVTDVFAAAARSGAAIPGAPVVATIKEAKDGKITRTVERAGLYEAQTPQTFEVALLRKAYENLKNLDPNKVTDDAFLVESLGHEVSIVESDASNIKITRPTDIAIAEAILASRPKPKPDGPVGPWAEAEW